MEKTRVCKKCGLSLPETAEYFHRHIGCKGGFRPECKKCRIVSVKTGYKTNRPHILEQKRQYYTANCEKIKGQKAEYRKACSERISKWGKGYYATNRALIKGKIKKYRSENPEKIRLSTKISKHKRRALIENLPASFTKTDWAICLKHFRNRCAYCGELGNILTQDHFIPVTKGGEYTHNNIIPACGPCNSSKHNASFFEWYPRQDFYNKEREGKILKYLNYDKKTKIQQLALL